MPETEIILVDNNPTSPESEPLRGLFDGWLQGHVGAARYIPMAAPVGTSVPRDRIFREAQGEYVLCMDSHVLLEQPCLRRLVDYYDAHPDCRDLIQGPMVYDNLARDGVSTHFNDEWRAEMWGTWGTDFRGVPGHPLYQDEPFDIPGQGLGLFSCRKDAWIPWPQNLRGFGGEEMCVHAMWRREGRRTLCAPWLRWVHRFGRPGGVKYPLSVWYKVRNYVIWFAKLGWPFDPIVKHFVETGRIPVHEWEQLIADPNNPPEWPAGVPLPNAQQPVQQFQAKPGCGSCGGGKGGIPDSVTLEEMYQKAANEKSDINEHVPKLRELAAEADTVVEFGMRRGVSTVALLAGQPRRFISYDVNYDSIAEALKARAGKTQFEFLQGDSLRVDIPESGNLLLFIDTKHTAQQLWAELSRHAHKSRRIALHDTQVYGEHGEGGGPGLLPAMRQFVREHPEWSVIYHVENNNGFTVLSRDLADKPKLPSTARQVMNFAKAWSKHKLAGSPILPEAAVEKRLDICSLCNLRVEDRCSKCGCFLTEVPAGYPNAGGPGKAMLPTEECPIAKWPAPITAEKEAEYKRQWIEVKKQAAEVLMQAEREAEEAAA